MWRSVPQTPQAPIRISAAFGPIFGTPTTGDFDPDFHLFGKSGPGKVDGRDQLLGFCDKEIVDTLLYHARSIGMVFRLGENVVKINRLAEDRAAIELESGKRLVAEAEDRGQVKAWVAVDEPSQ